VTAAGSLRPWPPLPPLLAGSQAIDGAGGDRGPERGFKSCLAGPGHGSMAGGTVCQKRRQKSGRCLHSKIGAWPLAFACGLQGVRSRPILGCKASTDSQDGHPEPARAVLGRRRLPHGMTNDHPASKAPNSMAGLEPCVDCRTGQRWFDADDFAHRPEPHRGQGPTRPPGEDR
jgi:hypothetical protein